MKHVPAIAKSLEQISFDYLDELKFLDERSVLAAAFAASPLDQNERGNGVLNGRNSWRPSMRRTDPANVG
jgi:hypothetical protein